MNEKQRARIAVLYKQYHGGLLAYARSSLGKHTLAEEAVQEVFRIACQKPDAICNSSAPEGWLIVTLKYVISNNRRTAETANRLLMEYMEAGEFVVQDEILSVDVLYSDISHTEEFKLLKEMAIEGRSYYEMAKDRGISYTACKQRVFRARGILQKKLEKLRK